MPKMLEGKLFNKKKVDIYYTLYDMYRNIWIQGLAYMSVFIRPQ